MRIFLDTNVIMDTLIEGRPSSEASAKIAELAKGNDFRVSVSALSLADAAYSIRRFYNKGIIKDTMDSLRRRWRVLSLNEYNIYDAINSECPDFEDAIQISIAEGDCDVIVTNNTGHFKDYTALEVVTPQEFLDKVLI